MRGRLLWSGLATCALILAHSVAPASTVATATAEDYERAQRFLAFNKDRYVINGDLRHHWIGKEDRFWVRLTSPAGTKEFVVVDAATGRRTPAFDPQKIASGLSRAVGTPIEATRLPFVEFRYVRGNAAIQFLLKGAPWTCVIATGACTSESPSQTALPGELLSPDRTRALSVRDHNLWVRILATGESFALTTDGIEHYDYASALGSSGHTIGDLRKPVPRAPLAIWSPDSRYVLTHRLDERQVKELYLLQSVPEDGSSRPKLYSYRYAMPGDEHVPLLEPVVFDLTARRQTKLATTPLVATIATAVERGDTWWSADSRTVYLLNRDRFSKSVALERADPVSGQVSEILRETSETTVGTIAGSLGVRSLGNGDVIWYSTRDGWGHLYYYAATGKLRNQITRGEWVVRSIVRIDESAKRIFFMAGGRERGRDPYEQRLYSVRFDGSDLKLLTPEAADHEMAAVPASGFDDAQSTGRFSVSGRYFVDSYSRPDMPPVFVVRRADGGFINRVAEADISGLRKEGYTPVEPFQVTAADGKTAIYGNLFRPSTFDASKKYPVIDSIYTLPSVIRTGKSFSGALFNYFEAQSLAELGFIVVTIDGRGTAYRSKAFLDYAYGHLDRVSDLDDHIAAIRELARRYPYMDIDRVGADGVSAGGYGAARAILAYPDFYKVAVAAEGNQDQRAGPAALEETMLGPLDANIYAAASNLPLAAHLKGKLLLMHGDLDESASPSLTLKLVDALVKADRDFDLVIVPNEGHSMFATSPYFIRKKWDYFVRNLRETP